MKIKIESRNDHKIIKLNRRKAIREKCLNCSSWSSKEVQNCQLKECHLYPYRIFTSKQNPAKRSKAIRGYCLKWCMAGQFHQVKLCPSKDCSLYPYRQSKVDKSVEIAAERKKQPYTRRRKRTLWPNRAKDYAIPEKSF